MKPYRKPTIVDHDGDLSKQWYVYFKWWDEDKQELIKAKRSTFPNGPAVNRIKNKKERYKQIGLLRDAIEFLLQKGWTPKTPVADEEIQPAQKEDTQKLDWSMAAAIDEIIRIKSGYLSEYALRGFRSKAKDFRQYLLDMGKGATSPTDIKRPVITEYLRRVKKTKGQNGGQASARTRNNYLTELHAIFEKMIEEDMMSHNPCNGISRLPETVSRHVHYTPKEMKLMGEWMDQHEPYLKKFSYFIGYAFLRPSEILRLRVSDIKGDQIHLRGSTGKTRKGEVIPIIGKLMPVIKELLNQATDPSHYLFTAEQKPGPQKVGGTQYFSKRFNRCKKYMNEKHGCNFDDNYDLYGVRHTFIRDIYLHFRESMPREQAEIYVMRITRHRTLEALRAYIRDYSIDLPEDWGNAYSIEY